LTLTPPRRSDTARRLRDLLRDQILSGTYRADGLPSEPELTRMLGASRNAVRDALALLSDEGLVERLRGVGTLTLSPKASHRVDRAWGMTTSAQPQGSGAGVGRELLFRSVRPAGDVVSEALQVARTSQVAVIERRTTIAGRPAGVWTDYLALTIAPGLQDLPDEDVTNLYTALELRLGLQIGRQETSIEAVPADAAVEELLEVSPGTPLLLLRRTVFLADGRKVDVGFGRFRGDALVLTSVRHRTPVDLT